MASNDTDLPYRSWLRDYRRYCKRRQAFRQDVMRASKAAFDAAVQEAGDSLAVPRIAAHARVRRATLTSKFCMVLWSRGVDENLFSTYAEGADLGRDREEGLRLLRYKASQFRPRIARLTAHLDLAGYFALVLWPAGQRGPSGPLVLKAPQGPVDVGAPERMDMWFYVFTGLVELAQAIIVEGNYGNGLATELAHIDELGLSHRILLFDNNGELYRFDDDQRWPLERVADAVAFAAGMNPPQDVAKSAE
jgi:hypothetical protein